MHDFQGMKPHGQPCAIASQLWMVVGNQLITLVHSCSLQADNYCNCQPHLEYQSCEHRNYEKSFAYLLIFNWRGKAFEKLQQQLIASETTKKYYLSLSELSRSKVYDQAEWAI